MPWARIDKDLYTGLYISTLLGGKFDNCHGQGRTPEQALISFKLAVRIRRKAMQ